MTSSTDGGEDAPSPGGSPPVAVIRKENRSNGKRKGGKGRGKGHVPPAPLDDAELLALEAKDQCEKNPFCTRGYHHRGNGGQCNGQRQHKLAKMKPAGRSNGGKGRKRSTAGSQKPAAGAVASRQVADGAEGKDRSKDEVGRLVGVNSEEEASSSALTEQLLAELTGHANVATVPEPAVKEPLKSGGDGAAGGEGGAVEAAAKHGGEGAAATAGGGDGVGAMDISELSVDASVQSNEALNDLWQAKLLQRGKTSNANSNGNGNGGAATAMESQLKELHGGGRS